MVPRFCSHRRPLAVFTPTGATPVPAGAEAKTQVLYLCEFHGNSPTRMKGFSFPINRRKKPKKYAPSPLRFWRTWDDDLFWQTKYTFGTEEGGGKG